MAERFQLTLYDGAYLEFTQARMLPLATLDSKLGTAAKALGLRVAPHTCDLLEGSVSVSAPTRWLGTSAPGLVHNAPDQGALIVIAAANLLISPHC
jgi:hypothetical protein